jgi:hypothetical protein
MFPEKIILAYQASIDQDFFSIIWSWEIDEIYF